MDYKIVSKVNQKTIIASCIRWDIWFRTYVSVSNNLLNNIAYQTGCCDTAGYDASGQHAEAEGSLYSSLEAFIVHIYTVTWLLWQRRGFHGPGKVGSWSRAWTGARGLTGQRAGSRQGSRRRSRERCCTNTMTSGHTLIWDIHLTVWPKVQDQLKKD